MVSELVMRLNHETLRDRGIIIGGPTHGADCGPENAVAVVLHKAPVVLCPVQHIRS